MSVQDLTGLLKGNPYPGRGIVLGRSEEGQHAFIAYFIMGRSENSRNRVFEQLPSGTVRTAAANPAKLADPSLIIYDALAQVREHHVVTNGDQTSTVCSTLEAGGTFEEALRTRTFEPDAPNYTPRISGLMNLSYRGFSYKLSILKSAGGKPESTRRFFYEYFEPQAGVGHFIHTYAGDGQPLPSFMGEPAAVALPGKLTAVGDAMWDALNAENKVALVIRSINLDGQVKTKIYNKYDKV